MPDVRIELTFPSFFNQAVCEKSLDRFAHFFRLGAARKLD